MCRGFPLALGDLITCQKDSGSLLLEDAPESEAQIAGGSLRCTTCSAKYRIEQGLLDLLAHQKPLDNISAKERAARNSEAETYDNRFEGFRNDTEIPSTLERLGDLSESIVLELGCGTGRFTTRLLKTAKQVIALDFSRQSLLILGDRIEDASNIGLVLADATQIRLAPGAFDLALSTQVFDHISTQVQRSCFLSAVSEALRREGIFVCTAYHQDLARRIMGRAPDGFHSSGISFHYFSVSEMTREVERSFSIEETSLIQIRIPLIWRFPSVYAWLSRTLEVVPFLNLFGHLILVRARKR